MMPLTMTPGGQHFWSAPSSSLIYKYTIGIRWGSMLKFMKNQSRPSLQYLLCVCDGCDSDPRQTLSSTASPYGCIYFYGTVLQAEDDRCHKVSLLGEGSDWFSIKIPYRTHIKLVDLITIAWPMPPMQAQRKMIYTLFGLVLFSARIAKKYVSCHFIVLD